jgi:DNA replication protein DnaC
MAQNLLIEHHLKRLKLPAMVRQYQRLAQEATQQNLSYQDYLLSVLELEVAQREENQQKRRIAQAQFPYLRTLDQFEFSAIPSLNHTRVLELAKGEYLSRQENIILVGNMGTCPSGPAPSP